MQGHRSDLTPSGVKLGYHATLEKLGIPQTSADRWVARYEEFIGERPPKQDADVVQSEQPDKVSQETASGKMAYESDPSAPNLPTSPVWFAE